MSIGFLLLLFFHLIGPSCTCMPVPTTEQEYNRSDIVMQGKVIGLDTVYASNTLINDKKGIRLGKHKYSVLTEKFVRVQMLVEKQFKTPTNLPDTVYILTPAESDACGFPFDPWLRYSNCQTLTITL